MDKPLLLDTMVFSLFLKPNDSRRETYTDLLEGRFIAISFATQAELFRWARGRGWGAKKSAKLEERIASVVVLPHTEAVSRAWARLKSVRGRSLSDNDAWIAACAEVYGCTLVTDDSDFDGFPGLDVFYRKA